MIDYNLEGMNRHIVEANIKLQDENKWLKEDKERLKTRIKRAINYIDDKGRLKYNPEELKDILKGKIIYEEGKKCTTTKKHW